MAFEDFKNKLTEEGEIYQDTEFPADAKSLMRKGKALRRFKDVKWVKAFQIYPNTSNLQIFGFMEDPSLEPEKLNAMFKPDKLNYGLLSNHSFLSAVAALMEYPELLIKLFYTHTLNAQGCIGI